MHNTLLPRSSRYVARRLQTPGWICSSCRHQSHMARTEASPKPFYVTTPIFYVNAAPHIGHLHSMVIGDIIKRYQKIRGRRAILCTGVDEHGLKVQQAAAKARSEPGSFCDKGAEVFKALASRANVDYDHFVRTSDSDHKEAVQYAWFLLKEKNLIYTSQHEGWYSVSDETFYGESAVQLVIEPWSGRKMMASKETGSEVEWTSETNYHFRLSSFRDRLLEFYRQNPGWITPPHRMQEVVNEVTAGLQDLSISRPSNRLSWGIPVPDDPSQTIYVWLDALTNYLTKAGYPFPPGQENALGWPADCQIIGKDIVRFHCIYWPAILMALGQPLPSRIYTHAHWLLGSKKMSKSTGNVVNPFFAIDRFGTDVIRFFLAMDGKTADDSNYANEYIIERYTKILQGAIGNLLSRTTRAKGWNVRQIVRDVSSRKVFARQPENPADVQQWQRIKYVAHEVENKMANYQVREALQEIVDVMSQSNKYISDAAPWSLSRDDSTRQEKDRQAEIIYLCAEALRVCGILLQPYMPERAKVLLDTLGVREDRRTFQHASIGRDDTYGQSMVEIKKGPAGVLFPPIPEG